MLSYFREPKYFMLYTQTEFMYEEYCTHNIKYPIKLTKKLIHLAQFHDKITSLM